MSKKKLLSEAQVKRFMGLAGLSPLNEMYHEKEEGMREEVFFKTNWLLSLIKLKKLKKCRKKNQKWKKSRLKKKKKWT